MDLRSFLVYFPKYQLILIVGVSERIGIHVSNVLLCPFPELFWPIYSLIIRNRWKLQNRNGWEFQRYWGAGVLLLCLSLKILFLLHVDKLYSSQALLNCHIATGRKSYRHSQADDLWKMSCIPLKFQLWESACTFDEPMTQSSKKISSHTIRSMLR